MQAKAPRWVSRLAYASSVATVCIVLAACGGGGGAGGAPTSPGGGAPTSTNSGPSAGSYPVTIQNCGHTLTFDKPPSRVVLPYNPMAEIFIGLGLADKAIGRTGWPGAPNTMEPPIPPDQAADFARIPVVGTGPPPPKEKMLSLRPDFLLAYGDFYYGGKNQGAEGLATLDELNAAGIQAYTVACPDEADAGHSSNENLGATYRTVLDLGKIFGVSDRAEQRVAAMQAQIADVSQKVGGQPKVKVIAYFTGEGPLNLAGGRDNLITQMIEAAGGENVFADQEIFFAASLEAVAGKQADAFLIFDNNKQPAAKATQFLFSAFPNMQASKDRRVLVLDQGLESPGWRNAQTVENIARQLHPDAFK